VDNLLINRVSVPVFLCVFTIVIGYTILSEYLYAKHSYEVQKTIKLVEPKMKKYINNDYNVRIIHDHDLWLIFGWPKTSPSYDKKEFFYTIDKNNKVFYFKDTGTTYVLRNKYKFCCPSEYSIFNKYGKKEECVAYYLNCYDLRHMISEKKRKLYGIRRYKKEQGLFNKLRDRHPNWFYRNFQDLK